MTGRLRVVHRGVVVRPPVFPEAFDRQMSFVINPGIGIVEWVES